MYLRLRNSSGKRFISQFRTVGQSLTRLSPLMCRSHGVSTTINLLFVSVKVPLTTRTTKDPVRDTIVLVSPKIKGSRRRVNHFKGPRYPHVTPEDSVPYPRRSRNSVPLRHLSLHFVVPNGGTETPLVILVTVSIFVHDVRHDPYTRREYTEKLSSWLVGIPPV